MNKKGMTLLEVLVSVALAATLMIFMYKLITDVSEEKKVVNSYNDNLLKVSEIEIELQNFLNQVEETEDEESSEKTIKYLTEVNIDKNNNKIKFIIENDANNKMTIDYSDSKTITIESNGNRKKWSFDNLKVSDDITFNENNDIVLIKIPLITNTNEISHIIEIPYYSPKTITIYQS